MKIIKRILFVIGLVSSIACISPITSLAKEVVEKPSQELNLEEQLDPETQELFATLNKYVFEESQGVKKFDYAAAVSSGESDVVLEIGSIMNNMSSQLAKNPQIASRILLPIGSYGNYCGKGQNSGRAPIDDLDRACQAHDRCYVWGGNNSNCNYRFRYALLPIIQVTPIGTYKYWYASAAFNLFS